MPIPTEPIGSIPGPLALIDAIAQRGDGTDYAEPPPGSFELMTGNFYQESRSLTVNDSSHEEEELRAVTLQNARSIFLARQRAVEELVRAKDELWRQSEWLRVTLASIGDAVVTTDTEGKVLSLNAVAEGLTGWTQQEAEGRPLTEVFQIVNADSREPVENPAKRALQEGRVVGLANHTILIARNGTETPIDDSAAPIRDDHGGIRGVVLVFRSIADRKRAEENSRRQALELADFFENASVGLQWVGPDGVVLRVNKAELDMLGYSREEYVGRHVAEFHVDQDLISDILRRLEADETLRNIEARMRCKDGSIKHVLIDSSVHWEDGRFIHTRCITRDITDRKQAEELQARLAAIVESSQDAIISKTLDTRILSWNAGAEQLFGYRAEEIIGRSITLLIPPERQGEEDMILARIRSGERVEHYETVRVSKHGRRVVVSLTISPIRDSTGRIIAVSKIARDITVRVRAEHRLAMQNGVTRTLAESAGLHEAAPRILRAICEHLDWQVGALWYIDEQVLRCAEVYHSPQVDAPRFEAFSRERVLERGIGLPGRVWATGEAVSIRDVVEDDSFLRAAMAEAEGLHGAVGFPIMLNEEVMGVMEFFSHEARQPDEDMLQMMTAIGSQIGQFIERRRAEEALRDSEMRFRLMAASVPSIIWTAAPDGTMTYANERWFEYCGLTSDQDGRGWLAVLHPDDEQRCVAAWTAALQQGVPFEIEVRHRRHDGVYRWFVTRAVPFSDARDLVMQWFGTTTDIDDRKRTEQTTRFLADASAALTTITDYESTLQAVVARAVPDFADWCVVDIREADGTVRRLGVAHVDPTKVQLINELDRKQSRESQGRGVRNVIRTGELEWAAEIPDDMQVALTQGDDHLRIIRELGVKSYISVPLKSRARVLGALTFVTAESGRAYGEDDVRAAEDLAHRAVIAIENSGLLSTLQEADRRKDEFLAMLAHELRNPLAPIRNAEQIIRAKGPPVPELQWATGVIDRQVHQMTRLVDDLLDVSRITRGKIELRKEFVDLAAIVDTAVEASRPLIEKWGHQLTVTIPSSPIRLEADPPRISQVLSNVLNNAAKYTRHDGRIVLTVELQGDHVLIRISDNGIGISAQALPRIFDMFTQEDRSLERAEGGLGIGLTLVKRLVEMHGGTVDARSEGLGKGSEFVVRLPVAIDVEARSPQRPADGQEAIAPIARRILIVDDNYDAADTLGILLGTTGNEVQTAHDGLEAVEKAAAFRPDVVLLDIGLPRLNGYEAARRIRQQEGGADIMLVALTGWGQAEDRRRSAEAGFDHHMTKPVEFNALQKLLAEAQPQR